MSEPLISVIIPCYNQGHFLTPAIDSILTQNYPHTEIIIINDGSTDQNTNQIISAFAHKRGRGGWETDRPSLKIFTIKNRGLSGARNFALTKVKGDFIQFLDADDQLLPQKFTRQLQHFSQNPHLDISYTKFYYQKGNVKTFLPQEAMFITNPLEDFLLRWETSLTLPPHVFLFKSKCFHQHRFDTGSLACSDWSMWSELVLSGHQLQFLNFVGAVYYQHESNMTSKKDYMYLSSALATAYIRKQIVATGHQDLLPQFDQAAITRLKYVFYQYFGDELIKNNPDRQELQLIKSTKFFKLWQKYDYFAKKLGLKF